MRSCVRYSGADDQYEQDDENQAQSALGSNPIAAVRPSGKCTHQQKNSRIRRIVPKTLLSPFF